MTRTTAALLTLVVGAAWQPSPADSYRLLPAESDLVIVTHKGGFAAGLGHDHLVAARGYRARIEFDPADVGATRFALELEVENLLVDDPDVQNRCFPRLQELGVKTSPFAAVSDGDRRKIRKAMLGKKQLDAAASPTLRATATVQPVDASGDGFSHEVLVTLEIRGNPIERRARATYDFRSGVLKAEALGEFLFTDFGIRPYSAFLGAVRNEDRFHVYVRLTAVAESS